MKILIVGCGKVGRNIASELIEEGHDIVLIDKNSKVVEDVSNALDVLGVIGDGASYNTLIDAGIKDADVLLAVTNSDELNLLCCLFAKKAGNVKTIARVRNPIYNDEIGYIADELGLAMIINPEISAAREIAKLLRFPSAIKIDSFEKDKLDILSFVVNEKSDLVGKKIMDSPVISNEQVLVVGIERGDEAIIPNGHTVIEKGDKLSVCTTDYRVNELFHNIGVPTSRIKSVMIVGASGVAYYLSKMLISSGIEVTLLEADAKRCKEIAELLPEVTIINGDATDQKVLEEENIEDYDAFISTTGMDEENIILSMYASKFEDIKVITKINRLNYNQLINGMNLGSIIVPKQITAESIIRFVRAMDNSQDNEIETLYQILNGKAEAISFKIKEESAVTEKNLLESKFIDNTLIAAIIRGRKIITPSGKDKFKVGDSVVIVTTHLGLNDITDILA